MATDDQVRVPVPVEVRRPGASAVPDGKRLASVHTEPFRAAPEDETVIIGDLRHDQVEPAVTVQVYKEYPARVLVDDAFVFEADPLGIFGVESVRTPVEYDDIRIVESTEDEIQVSVPVEVRATDPVGADGGQSCVRLAPEPSRLVEIHVRPRILVHRVFGRVGQDKVRKPVVVHVAT